MLADGNAVLRMHPPAFIFLERTVQVRAIQHFERTGVSQDVLLRRAGQDRRVCVVRVEVVRFPTREVVQIIAGVQVGGQNELAHIAETMRASRPFLRTAQCGQQERGEGGDDGDHDQQFDQREAAACR